MTMNDHPPGDLISLDDEQDSDNESSRHSSTTLPTLHPIVTQAQEGSQDIDLDHSFENLLVEQAQRQNGENNAQYPISIEVDEREMTENNLGSSLDDTADSKPLLRTTPIEALPSNPRRTIPPKRFNHLTCRKLPPF
jgi:hypothetical protein